ncbi:MAG: hypothetical protein ACLU6Y_19015 [Ruminococcus sp.]
MRMMAEFVVALGGGSALDSYSFCNQRVSVKVNPGKNLHIMEPKRTDAIQETSSTGSQFPQQQEPEVKLPVLRQH